MLLLKALCTDTGKLFPLASQRNFGGGCPQTSIQTQDPASNSLRGAACYNVEAEYHSDLHHAKIIASIWISIWSIKLLVSQKSFPTTLLAGTIMKRTFEHLIILLIYSHQEVKLINSSLMHTLLIFLHFPGHITSHKKRQMSPSNSHSIAGAGGCS